LSEWNLNTDSFRTLGWTSADAAGLPILPGLVRPDEALPASQGGQGAIDHAIRFTVQQTLDEYVYPASHEASSRTGSNLPRMGDRFRLKASFVIPASWPPEVKAVAQAMKDYGMIVADNGSNMYFQGVPSTQWNMDSMLLLRAIHATDFDVVDLTPVVTGLGAATGPTAGGTNLIVTGQNFSGAAGNLHVLFGTTPAAFTIVSDTTLNVTVPAHAAGSVDVRVQSGSVQNDADHQSIFFGYGTSANTAADDFTFGTSPPTSPPPTSPPPTSPPPTSPPTSPPPTSPPPTSPPPASPPTLVGYSQFATGNGMTGDVQLFNPDGTLRFALNAFPGLTGGVRVTSADFNGDGVADLVAGTGPGSATHVVILDGKDHHQLFAVNPFEAAFTGGVYVAAGDVNGDGKADLVITPDQGGGPRVRIFSGAGFTQMNDFFGIVDPNFFGGARAALGDVNGDGKDDLLVAAGFSGGPRVAIFDGSQLAKAAPPKLTGDFFLFEPSLRNGVFLTAGDLDGDGYADIIGGGGPGGGPRVLALSGKNLMQGSSVPIANFFAGNFDNRGGVRVVARNLDGDAKADLVVGDGTGAGTNVTAFLGKNVTATGTPTELFSFDVFPGYVGGVYVG
jgi:hypothetical protein